MSSPDRTHHIVTFRDASWAARIPRELEMLGLDPGRFASIENCPEPLHDLFYAGRHGSCAPPAILDGAAHNFLRWKGLKAHQLGCTILVDDAVEWVRIGCLDYGVELLDANAHLVASCPLRPAKGDVE
jgi:hypothetical protein